MRGIGVAVSTSTCGGVLPSAAAPRAARRRTGAARRRRRARGRRTRPMSLSSACVPTTMRDWPDAAAQQRLPPLGGGQLPGEQGRHELGRELGAEHARRSSAGAGRRAPRSGASSADCPPESATASMARSATSVLPEPTSPCTSRFIGSVGGEVLRRSPRPPLTGRAVSANGRRRRSGRGTARRRQARLGVLPRAAAARCCSSAHCSTNASWNRSAVRARRRQSASFAGRWMSSRARRNGSRPRSVPHCGRDRVGTSPAARRARRRSRSATASWRRMPWPGRSGSAVSTHFRRLRRRPRHPVRTAR